MNCFNVSSLYIQMYWNFIWVGPLLAWKLNFFESCNWKRFNPIEISGEALRRKKITHFWHEMWVITLLPVQRIPMHKGLNFHAKASIHAQSFKTKNIKWKKNLRTRIIFYFVDLFHILFILYTYLPYMYRRPSKFNQY